MTMSVMADKNEAGDLNCIFRKRGEIVARCIAGETILVPVRGKLADMQRIFSLSPVAAFLWEQIDGTQDLEVILSKVIEDFEVEREDAATDLRDFITELLEAGLIEEVVP
jgi:hypothetical protein